MILLYFLVNPSKYLSPNNRASLSASRLSKIFEIKITNKNSHRLCVLIPQPVMTCGALDPQLAFPGLWRLPGIQTPQIESQKRSEIVKHLTKTSMCAAGRSATSPSPNLCRCLYMNRKHIRSINAKDLIKMLSFAWAALKAPGKSSILTCGTPGLILQLVKYIV